VDLKKRLNGEYDPVKGNSMLFT